MRRYPCARVVLFVLALSLLVTTIEGVAAEAPKSQRSIAFADESSKQHFEEYRAFLERDPNRFAAALATIDRLERSDIQYVISIGGRFGRGVEGTLSADGSRVAISLAADDGPGTLASTLVARLAHELEHARQFDAGELALARDPTTGRWASHFASYDLGDEVKAWQAQLLVATTRDFWTKRDGCLTPTVLCLFANAPNDAARARLLASSGYRGVNPIFDCNFSFAERTGYVAGQVLRPGDEPGRNLFGRVYSVEMQLQRSPEGETSEVAKSE